MKKIVKKIVFATVTDYRGYPRYFWEGPLKNLCEDFIWFDLEKLYKDNGKIKAQEKFLKFIEKEKPDYIFMADSLFYDLDVLSIFSKLRALPIETKTVCFAGDDDFTFDASRYLALFFDYYLVAQGDYIPLYKKDGRYNAFFMTQITPTSIDKNVKKIYDVSFIGAPKSDRKEIVEYLYKKGVDISLFGAPGWKNYPELEQIYKGSLSSEDLLKTVTKTKINICLSTNMVGVPHMKGRFLEYAECKAFSLVENSPQLAELFKEGKEIVFFKTKKELLDKINYYLDHDKERGKIALASYRKIKKNFDFGKEIGKFLSGTKYIPKVRKLPELNYSVFEINEKNVSLSKKSLYEKTKSFEYVSFSRGNSIKSQFKDYLQVYSLVKNKKEISCCDYFISSKFMGDLARFRYCPFGKLDRKNYNPFLNINQIIVTREYFIQNLDLLRQSYLDEEINFVNNENTSFVSVPLVKISKFRNGFFNNSEFSNDLGLFLLSFHRELYSRRKNPIKFIFYSVFLLKEILFGKKFIWEKLRNWNN